MLENKSTTPLSQIGEFGLIEKLTEQITLQNPSSLKGIGDDAAVIDFASEATVISTDMLVEGIHFDLSYVPLRHLGYKAVMVNLSDIYAMNAIPSQITVSIAVSSRFPLEAIEELYSGIYLACEKHRVDVVGGDTSSSLSGMIISITAIGHAQKEEIVYRNGAKDKNLLVVSGDLGGAYMGLQVLEREKNVFKENPNLQPDLEGFDYILERQLKPEARKDIPSTLRDLGVKPTSMIDISDGLASEILHLCKQSNVGCNLYEEKIPLDAQTYNTARDFNLDPTLCALSGGEDYELLFTMDIHDIEKIKNHPDFTVIGHILSPEAGTNLISKNGTVHPLTAQGWNSFKK
jgi:thiamine-monophosphate kinase